MSTFVMPGELQNGFIPINAGFIINNSEMHSQLYSPKQKDSVLGVILSKIQETYKVDIGTTTPALLGFSAFEGASKRNRPTLLPGDLVFARISFTDRDMETELECMNADGKTDGYGQLQDGYLLKCSTLMSKNLMDSTNVILQAMAEICAFEIVVGANGKVWIKSADLKSMTLLIAIIKHCDGLHSSAVQSYLATIIKKYKN